MFNWFKKQKTPAELEERVERIERGFKNLQVEWAETYDKFRQLQWRVAKRAKQLENQAPDEGGPQPDGGSVDTSVSGTASALSPRLARIQAQILARRRGTTNGGTE